MSKEKEYILKASSLEDGDSLFIPVNTKKEQQRTFTRLNNLAKDFTAWVEPDITLAVCKTFQDKKLWIKIIKDKAPDKLFILKKSGDVKPLDID